MMAPVRTLAAVALMNCVAPAVLAQEQSITIKVVSAQNVPVESRLQLNPGGKPVGDTTASGEYRFKHKCEIGQTFKAFPQDGRFYNSEEKPCAASVRLEVFSRPSKTFSEDEVAIFKPAQWSTGPTNSSSPAAIFAGVSDKAEPLGTKCRVTIEKKLNVGIYNPRAGNWTKIGGMALPGNAENATYLFASSCKEAEVQVWKLKATANAQVSAAAETLSNSPQVGVDVRKAISNTPCGPGLPAYESAARGCPVER